MDSSSAALDTAWMALTAAEPGSAMEVALAIAFAQEDQVTAGALLDSMAIAFPYDRYWQVQQMAFALLTDEKDLTELDANGQATLETIAADGKEGAAEALAWLMLLGADPVEDIVLPSKAKRTRMVPNTLAELPFTPLRVFPNPSNGPVNVVYEVPAGVERAELRMMDVLGRTLYSSVLGATMGTLELVPNQPSTGMHVIALFYDGYLVATEKVTLTRR